MSFKSMMIAPFKTGLDTDAEPWLAPADSFREADNLHIHHGYLQKREGYSLFGTLSKGLRVMGIERFIKSDGVKVTLAFDTENAYLYDSVGLAFNILDSGTPIFGSGEFDYIWGCNWQSSNVVNRLYFTNGLALTGGVNGLRYFDITSPTTTTLLNPTVSTGVTLDGCKLVFTLGQRLVLLYTYELNGVTQETHPQRARWCAKQDPNNWNDTVAGGGDYADAATGDQIVSAKALKNQIIVFFTNSVWSLQPTSDPNRAFRWVRLNNYRACDGKMASVNYDRMCIGIGGRGITATNGSETKRIDQRIVDFTSNTINFAQFGKVFCYRNYESQRWWTLFPSIESEENNKALIYDDESKAYTTYSINMNCLGYGNASIDYSLDDFNAANNLDFSLNEVDNSLDDYQLDEREDILLGGDISGNIYQMNLGIKDVETNIAATFTTAAWNPYQGEGKEAQMAYVDFYVDTESETKGTVEFYVNDQTTPYISQQIKFLPNLNFVASVTSVEGSSPCVVTAPGHGLVTGNKVFIYGSTFDALTITGITQANPAVVTVNSMGNLQEGQIITITGVEGMTEVNYNGTNTYTVSNISGSTFELTGINSTGYTAYTSGGNVQWGMSEINSGNGYTVTVIDQNTITLSGVDASLFSPYTGGASIYLKQFYQDRTWVRAYGGGIGYTHWLKVSIEGGSSLFRLHAIKPAFKPRGKRMIN